MIREVLKSGPLLSSQVARILESKGKSPVGARKIVQRAGSDDEVFRLNGIRFPHNQRLLYLLEHVGTEKMLTGLLDAFDQTNSAYGITLKSLVAYGGIIPESLFGVVSGSPALPMKGQVGSERILEQLLLAGILTK